MMRNKWMALGLALVMLLTPMCAMAEDEEDYELYEDPAGRYSFSYPDSWEIMDSEDVNEFFEEAADVDDEELRQDVENLMPLIRGADMLWLEYWNGEIIVNIVYEDLGLPANDKVLQLLGSKLKAKMADLLPTLEFQEEGMDAIGDYPALAMVHSYTVESEEYEDVVLILAQVMMVQDSAMYTISVVGPEGRFESEDLGEDFSPILTTLQTH